MKIIKPNMALPFSQKRKKEKKKTRKAYNLIKKTKKKL